MGLASDRGGQSGAGGSLGHTSSPSLPPQVADKMWGATWVVMVGCHPRGGVGAVRHRDHQDLSLVAASQDEFWAAVQKSSSDIDMGREGFCLLVLRELRPHLTGDVEELDFGDGVPFGEGRVCGAGGFPRGTGQREHCQGRVLFGRRFLAMCTDGKAFGLGARGEYPLAVP